MADPKVNAKMTGDTHLPDVESDLPLEGMSDDVGADGTPSGRGKSSERDDEGRPGRGSKKAGVLKDRDAQTSDSDTRDSGEGSGPDRG